MGKKRSPDYDYVCHPRLVVAAEHGPSLLAGPRGPSASVVTVAADVAGDTAHAEQMARDAVEAIRRHR